MKRIYEAVFIVSMLLLSACGAEDPTISVKGAHLGEDTVENPSPPSDDDEIILPSGTAPTPEVSPTPETPEIPAPVADPVAAFSLHLDAEKKFETRLGLVRLHVTAAGPIEELYLWSDGFNREKTDKNTDDPCGPIADAVAGTVRHVLVNAMDGPNLGAELNDGSPAHAALIPYLDSARLCDASICEGFVPSVAPACRIDLDPSRAPSLYTRALAPDAVYRLCARTAEGVTCVASEPVAASEPYFSEVTAAFSPEGSVRVTLDYANAVRAAKAPAGCAEVYRMYNDRDRGRGTLVADCPIDQAASRNLAMSRFQTTSGRLSFGGIAFAASGVGRSASESISIDAADPTVALQGPYGFEGKEDGCVLETHCEGTVKFRARASRAVTVTRTADGAILLAGKTAAGLGWIHLRGNDDLILPDGKDDAGLPKKKTIARYELAGTESVPSVGGEAEVIFKGIARNHGRFRWKAEIEASGKKFESAAVALPYVPSFKVTQTDAMAGWTGKGWDGHVMTIEAHHIKDIDGICVSPDGPAFYSILHPGWGYAPTTNGTLHPTSLAPASTPDPTVLRCHFWGVSHDGQAIEGGTFTWGVP